MYWISFELRTHCLFYLVSTSMIGSSNASGYMNYQGFLPITKQIVGDDHKFVKKNPARTFEMISVNGEPKRDGFRDLMH